MPFVMLQMPKNVATTKGNINLCSYIAADICFMVENMSSFGLLMLSSCPRLAFLLGIPWACRIRPLKPWKCLPRFPCYTGTPQIKIPGHISASGMPQVSLLAEVCQEIPTLDMPLQAGRPWSSPLGKSHPGIPQGSPICRNVLQVLCHRIKPLPAIPKSGRGCTP